MTENLYRLILYNYDKNIINIQCILVNGQLLGLVAEGENDPLAVKLYARMCDHILYIATEIQ